MFSFKNKALIYVASGIALVAGIYLNNGALIAAAVQGATGS